MNIKYLNEIIKILHLIFFEQEDKPDKWRYLAVKSIPRLFRRTTSNHDGDFYCLGCLHFNIHVYIHTCDNHDYCNIVMPDEDKIIKSSKHNLCRPRMFINKKSVITK